MNKIKMLTNLLALLIVCSSCSKIEPKVLKLTGSVFGTSFHITYLSHNLIDYSSSIDSIFRGINKSLSTYDSNSYISRINRGEKGVIIDANFKEVFHKAEKIYQETDGVFDPTIGILVNAWGFGPESKRVDLDAQTISGLLTLVGFDKVSILDGVVLKKDPKMYIDFNAIAKGFGIDAVSRFLEYKGVTDYMVEVGGEVRSRGKNSSGNYWRIGIEKPNFDGSRELQQIIELKNESIATSGNYRKFIMDSITGEKYVHTIDPVTGYTAKRDLLSVSVISSLDCADVDAYATAFMAMGFQKTKQFVALHDELKVFLIYINEAGEIKEFSNFSKER
jgi:FAD:protein FMN transferase